MITYMMKQTDKNILLCKVGSSRALKIIKARGYVEVSKDEWNRQLEAKRALLGWEAQS